MSTLIPKATRVKLRATFLEITFDNNEKKYLKLHALSNLIDISTKKGDHEERQFSNMLWRSAWIGAIDSKAQIEKDGSIILKSLVGFPPDVYLAEEIWDNSVDSISQIMS